MLTDAIKAEIRARFAAIAAAMPEFRSRPGQRIMIAEIAKTLARCPESAGDCVPARPQPGSTCVCIQGGTGIGKSLAYTLAGVILARQKKKTLLISTATIALQEQLIEKDLPLFLKASGIEATVELAKGRTRFVCQYRLLQLADDLKQTAMFGREKRAGRSDDESDAVRGLLDAMVSAYSEGRWDGDRDKWPGVEDALWSSITTDRHGCLNRNCPSFHGCAQIAARKRLKAADIVVVNHDLLLADLAMGGGRILSKPEESFIVIDEGHHLPTKSVAAFSSSHMVGAAKRMAERLIAFAPSLGNALGASFDAHAEEIVILAQRLAQNLGDAHRFFAGLAQLTPTESAPRPTLEFKMSCIPEEFAEMGENVRAASNGLLQVLGAASETLADALTSGNGAKLLLEKIATDTGFFVGRLEEIHATWEMFLEEPALDQPPIAKWVETVGLKRGHDYAMAASPVLASGYLRRLLWDKAAGVIVTSATMSVLGSFDDFLRRSGLAAYESVACVELPSPFDYAAQATLTIEKMSSSAKNHAAHTVEVAQRIPALIERCGALGILVLFTSRRQMEEVARTLPEEFAAQVLVQGTGSKQALIEEHKARIVRGERSVIFGMDSFAEGVDLPGRACEQVIIAKMPFPVPDNPILSTLSDWIERRGGNPFLEIFVPDAARKLEQGIGRLIRTETDVGTVNVLDMRLWTTPYGRSILRGLPPFRIVAMGREVRP